MPHIYRWSPATESGGQTGQKNTKDKTMKFRQNGHTYATPDQAFVIYENAARIDNGKKMSFIDFCIRNSIILTDFVRC